MRRSLINITNLKKQLFCFFLFVPALLISQTNIDGYIKDNNNTPIDGANIILKKTNTDEIITFTTSNAKGYFNLQTETGNYTLKISALGFETILKNIELKNTTLSLNNIALIENSTALEEVIINAENNGIVQKGDVTQYKIEKFLNGTEESLKDVITRLPGLDINENGKITANGKEIDRLLIDGENLYKKQHQLATENINSEMVKNAELIRNYKDFESISTNDKTGITALNINIKEEFKNKFTGNFETHLGFKDKYKVNASLFNFNKRVKFSLIPSSNNLGESTMSIQDYYALTDTDVRSNLKNESKVTFSKLEDLPRFLNSNNNVATKSNNFVTISSIANLSDKIKLDFYGIFNNAEQEENYSRELLFKMPQTLDEINENNKIIEENYFGVLQLKSIYKPNKNSVLTINNYINIDNTNQDKDIENLTNIKYINTKETNKPKKINFNSEINYRKNINSNTFTSSLSFNYLDSKSIKNIYSNNAFLNINFNDEFVANQSINKSLQETNFYLAYTLNYNKVSIDLYNNTTFTKDKLTSNTNNLSSFYNNISLDQLLAKNGIDVTFKISKTINYTIGANYNYTAKTFNTINNNINYLEFNSSIKSVFNTNNIAQISYKFSNQTPFIDHLNDGFIIKDYRNLIVNNDLAATTLLPYHQISASHFIFKPKSEFSYIFNASYISKNKSIGNNIINTENVSISTNKIIRQDNMFNTFLFLDKKLKKLPLSFSGSLSYNTNKKEYFQDNNLYHFQNENISSILKVKSQFKKAIFHFDLGFKYSKDNYTDQNSKTYLRITQPYLNTNGKISKNLFWYLNSSLTFYNSTNSTRKLYLISPKLRFIKEKSKWEIYVTGNNILNLNHKTILENNSSPSFYEEKTSATLAGHLLLGGKLKF